MNTEPAQPLVRKANAPQKITVTPAGVPTNKRGRKPTGKVDAVITEQSKLKVGTKRGTGKKEVKPKKVLPEMSPVVPAEKIAANAHKEKPIVTVEPKPKRKRIHNADHKGKVLLTGWGKSVSKKWIEQKNDEV